MSRDLASIIREGTRLFGSKQALAQAVGLNPSRLSRLAHHDQYSLNIENCLRLAQVTRISASEVLRAAGKGEIAELIESLYGEVRTHETPAQRHHGDLHPSNEPESIVSFLIDALQDYQTKRALSVPADPLRRNPGTGADPPLSPPAGRSSLGRSERTTTHARRQAARTGTS